MRVIAGELKGQRLVAPKGWKVRPTSDRVREAIFSALGDRVEGSTVLDLYCGTGALAIEALSRGAARATLVDHCLKCHGGAATKGEFDLSTREALLRDATATLWHPERPHPSVSDAGAAALGGESHGLLFGKHHDDGGGCFVWLCGQQGVQRRVARARF